MARQTIKGEISVHKSDYDWDSERPWVVSKGDCRASFGTEKEATNFAKVVMPYAYICPITGIPKINRSED